ncbi:SOSS complex subunit C isoform X4 [Heterodontus francisci]|uniref:SOSS complex subunit C isoform X4 n=1 Tax=Heterodontus francisci TaxID=7792 RepID=UPI00355BBEEC
MEFGCSTEMTTNPPAPDPTEAAQDQVKSRIRRVYVSKKSEPLISEDDTTEEKYGCVVDRCFPRLQTCTNGKMGITGNEERQILQVHCVIEFGACATTCLNNYKNSNNV